MAEQEVPVESKMRWLASVFAAALVASVLIAPAGAHIGTSVGHLWDTHILPRIVALPDCPSDQALRGFGTGGAPQCASLSSTRGFSTFKDFFRLTTAAGRTVQVAQLNLPAGRYVAVAKLYTGPPISGLNEHVRCNLTAGGDFDRAVVNHDATIAFVSLSLNVAHEFTSPGTVTLNCGHDFTSGDTNLFFVKISAVEVANLSNVGSP